jgi:CheY-like chemotaxis protein
MAPESPGKARRRAKTGRETSRPAGARSHPVELALASLAHEIRTPLNGILALAELLAASGLPERERGWAASLKGAAEHLARLTTIVVDGARAQADGLPLLRETFDPRGLAREIAASFSARAAAKGLAAHAHVAEELPAAVVGDPVRLRAVLENLIDNAVKFTAAGRVAFTASGKLLKSGHARLVFTVEDQGVGLSPQELRRLFRPFAQAREDVGRRFGGAGLGLALSRGIARAMGGDLTVRSAARKRTMFRLQVVAARPQVPAARSTRAFAAPAPLRPLRPLRLLCAEDNPYGRVVLNAMLSALGHGADFVEDGAAAVAAARTRRYDAVLLDLVLPGTGGLQAARRIRALAGAAGKVPIVGISGRGGAQAARRAQAAGMDRYLVKPVSPRALAEALDALTPARRRRAHAGARAASRRSRC